MASNNAYDESNNNIPMRPHPSSANSLNSLSSLSNPVLCIPITSSTADQTNANVNNAAGANSNNHHQNKNTASTSNINSSKSTRAKSRKNRVYALRSFLLKTYFSPPSSSSSSASSPTLRMNPQSTTILDVAGGKGDLSWLLINADNVQQSVVVDPRPSTSHVHLIRSVQFLKNNPDICKERRIKGKDSFQPLALVLPQLLEQQQQRQKRKMEKDMDDDGYRENTKNNNDCDFISPKHLRVYLDDALVSAVRSFLNESPKEERKEFIIMGANGEHEKKRNDLSGCKDDCENNDENTIEVISSSFWDLYWSNALSRTANSNNINSESINSDIIIQDASIALNLLINQVNLIVGFHPDQATEACVDLALLLRIPFAIVPCCVFPSEFPNRYFMSEEGEKKKVRSYYDFIEYLKNKHCRIKMDYLDFFHESPNETARKIVLYMLPEDYDSLS